MKRLFLLGAFCLVAVVVSGFFAAREVAQSSNTPGMSLLASAAPQGDTLSGETPSFSVGRGGPSGLSPADIFNLGPLGSIPCQGLGLALTGDCVPPLPGPGHLDNVDALSYGRDFTVPARSGNWLFFSVAPGSTGLAGTAVKKEASVPCVPAEPEADEFASAATGTNIQYYDGDGAACDGNAGGPIGLTEKPTSDNLDALDEFSEPQIHYGGAGGPGMVWFSLDPASLSLGAIGPAPPASAGDILLAFANAGVVPVRWATAASLGLVGGPGGDDIDALCIKAGPSPTEEYRPGIDLVWLSLAPGSPTLGAPNNWSAADILQAGPLGVFKTAAQLGLNASDNLDALKCLTNPVGGIAELPSLAATSADEAGTPAGGSGWSAASYAALAAGLAAAVVVLSAGWWYARRRLLR